MCIFSNPFWSPETPLPPKKRQKSVQENLLDQKIIFSGHKIAVSGSTTPPKRFYSYSRNVWGHSLLFFLCEICLISVCIFSYEHLLGSKLIFLTNSILIFGRFSFFDTRFLPKSKYSNSYTSMNSSCILIFVGALESPNTPLLPHISNITIRDEFTEIHPLENGDFKKYKFL